MEPGQQVLVDRRTPLQLNCEAQASQHTEETPTPLLSLTAKPKLHPQVFRCCVQAISHSHVKEEKEAVSLQF